MFNYSNSITVAGKKLRTAQSPVVKVSPKSVPSSPVANIKCEPTSDVVSIAEASTKLLSPKQCKSPALNASTANDASCVKNESSSASVVKAKPPAATGGTLQSFFTGGTSKSESQAQQDAAAAYNPAKSDYDPVADAFWRKGEK